LYAGRIFGGRYNLRCDCGALTGEDFVVEVCEVCDVQVCVDVAREHRRRFGHIALAAPCAHPMNPDELIDELPILPVGFRVDEDGSVNPLGRRYEALVEANVATRDGLPDRHAEAYYPALLKFDNSRLSGAVADLVGRSDRDRYELDDGSLLQRLCTAVRELSPDVATLLRACLCSIKLDVTL
jgi:hypothetical protein